MSLIADVALELRKLSRDPQTLKKFGMTMAAALGILGGLVFFLGSHPQRAYWFWALAAIFLVLGWLFPAALRQVHTVWMGLAFVLGWFVSRLILSILFFLVITPIGLIVKLTGKDPLDRKIDKQAESYWIKRPQQEIKPERYEKLF